MLSHHALGFGRPASRRESLPFRLRLVRDEVALRRAIVLRQQAYARHLPEFAASLGEPEAADRRGDTVVLLAESKLDGAPLCTMRIQTNALGPLALESSMNLPEHFQGLRLAEATRLGVVGAREGQLAKTLVFKAYLMLCLSWGVDQMVVTARRPVDRLYEGLKFTDVIPSAGYVPMAHVGGLGHRVMSLEAGQVENIWRACRHPLVDFFFDTEHPDLEIEAPDLFRNRPVLLPALIGAAGDRAFERRAA